MSDKVEDDADPSDLDVEIPRVALNPGRTLNVFNKYKATASDVQDTSDQTSASSKRARQHFAQRFERLGHRSSQVWQQSQNLVLQNPEEEIPYREATAAEDV